MREAVILYVLDLSPDSMGPELARLATAARDHRNADYADAVAFTDPSDFSAMFGSTFAYWAGERVLKLFPECCLMEGNAGTVKQGHVPAGDFRFVRARWEEAISVLGEIESFEGELQMVAGCGWVPELDDGVVINLAPLHAVVPWQEPENVWTKLERGDYDWAHLALRYWPERVREKCQTDKSLAIAHSLETDLDTGG